MENKVKMEHWHRATILHYLIDCLWSKIWCSGVHIEKLNFIRWISHSEVTSLLENE